MSTSANYVRVAAEHIDVLQKDLIDAWYDLHPSADYPDKYPDVNDILNDLPGDVEILTIDGWEILSWLLSPLKREETRRRAPRQLVEQDSWPAIDLLLVAIEARDSQLGVPAVDFGLGEGAAFDPTTVQRLSAALSQITPEDLLRNFDFDTMHRINLRGFGRSFIPDEEEKSAEEKRAAEERAAEELAKEERLARECVDRDFQALQQFYRRAAASGQYVIIGFA